MTTAPKTAEQDQAQVDGLYSGQTTEFHPEPRLLIEISPPVSLEEAINTLEWVVADLKRTVELMENAKSIPF